MQDNSVRTCPKCGKRWVITEHHSIMRDKDSLDCDCGEELMHWNGGVFYTAKPYEENKSN